MNSKNPTEIAIETITRSKNVLLVTHAKMDVDALGSILSFYSMLKKMGKKVTAVCADAVPEAYKFFPNTNLLKNSIGSSQNFIIHLSTKNANIEHLKYKIEKDKVNIIVSPKSGGEFSEDDVSFEHNSGEYDLIIVLDCADKDQMGLIYEKHTELFYNIPVINIDHHVSNTYFGKINVVDFTAASTTEILTDLFFNYLDKDKKMIDSDIATLLLGGIITDTGSFQNPNTTPKSFEVAADLIDLGARQQEIIKKIYRTKKLSTLKLWGIALSKIKNDPVYRIVWSTISQEDLKEAQAKPENSEGIIDELLSNAPGAEIVLLMKEMEDKSLNISIRTSNPTIEANKIAAIFGGGGHVQASGFKIPNTTILDSEAEIIEKIKKFQDDRLNLSNKDLYEEKKLPGEIDFLSTEGEPEDLKIDENPIVSDISEQDFDDEEDLEDKVDEAVEELKKEEDNRKIFGAGVVDDLKDADKEGGKDEMDDFLSQEAKAKAKEEIYKKQKEKEDESQEKAKKEKKDKDKNIDKNTIPGVDSPEKIKEKDPKPDFKKDNKKPFQKSKKGNFQKKPFNKQKGQNNKFQKKGGFNPKDNQKGNTQGNKNLNTTNQNPKQSQSPKNHFQGNQKQNYNKSKTEDQNKNNFPSGSQVQKPEARNKTPDSPKNQENSGTKPQPQIQQTQVQQKPEIKPQVQFQNTQQQQPVNKTPNLDNQKIQNQPETQKNNTPDGYAEKNPEVIPVNNKPETQSQNQQAQVNSQDQAQKSPAPVPNFLMQKEESPNQKNQPKPEGENKPKDSSQVPAQKSEFAEKTESVGDDKLLNEFAKANEKKIEIEVPDPNLQKIEVPKWLADAQND